MTSPDPATISSDESELTKITRRHRVEHWVYRTMRNFVLRLGPTGLRITRLFFRWLLGTVFRANRNVIDANLAIAFQDATPAEREDIARKNYDWVARVMLEILRMSWWPGRTESLSKFHNIEDLDEALEDGKGALVVSMHFGNWEMITPALAEKGYDTFIYVGAQSNPLVNKDQVDNRECTGAKAIHKGPKVGFQFMRALRGRNVVTLLADQNDRKSDLFVDFLGRKASVQKGLAGFHIARKSPIVFTYAVLEDDITNIYFKRLRPELTGDKEQDQHIVTQMYFDEIGKVVRKWPSQYFWMHRRYRTRPPGDTERIYD